MDDTKTCEHCDDVATHKGILPFGAEYICTDCKDSFGQCYQRLEVLP